MYLEDKVYDLIIRGYELTKKNLNASGLTDAEITTLRYAYIISYVGDNRYKLKDYRKLYIYGKKILSQKRVEEAEICFKKCYEHDNNLEDVALRLFLLYCNEENYPEAVKYFKGVFNNPKYPQNIKLIYLYILSVITELPKEYKNYAKDICLEDFEFTNAIDQEMYGLILNQSFVHAYKKLNEKFISSYMSITDVVLKKLILIAIQTIRKEKEEIYNLTMLEEYEKLDEYFKNLDNKHQLNAYYKYSYKLIKDILRIINEGVIPENTNLRSHDVYEAILNNDYARALYLQTNKVNKNERVLTDHNFLYLLLENINNMINNLGNNLDDVEGASLEEKLTELDNIAETGIIYLPNLEHSQAREIKYNLKSYPNIKIFSLESLKEEQVVILYEHVYKKDDYINFKELFGAAEGAFRTCKYEDALKIYRQILALSGKKIRYKSNLFYKIGYLYSVIPEPNYNLALDYLNVAEKISEIHEDYLYDYRPIIYNVMGKLAKQNKLTRKKPE